MSTLINTGFPWTTACQDVTALNGDLFDIDAGKIGQIIFTHASGTGTITFQGSNYENFSNLVALTAYNASSGSSSSTATSTGTYLIIPTTRYVRARVTTYTSGTFSGVFTVTDKEIVPPVCQASVQVASISAGSTLIGDVAGQIRAGATGGATIKHIVSAATTNAANIKSSAGRVCGWSLSNTSATWQYVKLYNSSSAPTVGTTTVVMTIAIPPSNNSVMAIDSAGIAFSSGIGMSIVTGSADNDATATTLGAVVGDIFYA